MNLFFQPLLPQGVFYLDQDESRHAVKVLRKNVGDQIRLTDGQGMFYDATITVADPFRCTFDINDRIPEPRRNFAIHIAISPTKNPDRIEWFVEKSVELGVDEITLLKCDHTERQFVKLERLQKMAISAMKQSLKASLPIIHPLINFRNIVLTSGSADKYIAHVDNANQVHLRDVVRAGSSYLVLVGPEGDFTDEEVGLAEAHAFKKVSLGASRLRTETAGLAVCHILNLANTP